MGFSRGEVRYEACDLLWLADLRMWDVRCLQKNGLISKRWKGWQDSGGTQTRLIAAHGPPRSLSVGCVAKIGELIIYQRTLIEPAVAICTHRGLDDSRRVRVDGYSVFAQL